MKKYPLFKFACGCIRPHPGYQKTRVLRFCEVHNQPAVGKIFKCKRCGKEFETRVTVTAVKHCPECRPIIKKEHDAKYYKLSKLSKSERLTRAATSGNTHLKAMVARADCCHRDECMRHFDFQKGYIECCDCPRYCPGPPMGLIFSKTSLEMEECLDTQNQ